MTQAAGRRRSADERRAQSVELRRFLGIAQEDFARLVGVSVRTVARWEHADVEPNPDLRARIGFLLKLSKLLDEVIDREHIADWLTTPNPAFLDQPPVDLVQSVYGRRVLEQEIERAGWGIPG